MSIAKIGKKQSKSHVESKRKSLIQKYTVLQFDWNGTLLNEYPCPIDASRITGKSLTHILKSISNKTKFTKDFIWMYKLGFTDNALKDKIAKYRINKYKTRNSCNKAVVQCNPTTGEIKEWLALSQIRKELGHDKSNVVEAIKNKRLAYNCYWQFKI